MSRVTIHRSTGILAILLALGIAPSFSYAPRSSALAATAYELPSQDSPPQQSPPKAPVPSSTGRISHAPMRMALPRRTYRCADDVRVNILVEPNEIRLTLNDHIYDLKQADTSDGTKYSYGSIIWTTKEDGENGTLVDNSDTSHSQLLAKDCHLESAFPLAASAPTKITGTVTFDSHQSVPNSALLVIQLQDVTLEDAPAPVIAESKLRIGGHQPPIPFELTFDPTKIDPKHSYALEASILVHGKLRFTNDTRYPVLTKGDPANQNLVLITVGADAHPQTP